jgi:hypothetical protein
VARADAPSLAASAPRAVSREAGGAPSIGADGLRDRERKLGTGVAGDGEDRHGQDDGLALGRVEGALDDGPMGEQPGVLQRGQMAPEPLQGGRLLGRGLLLPGFGAVGEEFDQRGRTLRLDLAARRVVLDDTRSFPNAVRP